MTTAEHPVFDHPMFPGNRKAAREYLKEQAKRGFWFKIKFSLCLVGAVAVGSFLYFSFLFTLMPLAPQ